MALITCDECGRQISDKSVACPNCGYPTHLNKALNTPPADEESKPTAQTAAMPTVVPPPEPPMEATVAVEPEDATEAAVDDTPEDFDPEEHRRHHQRIKTWIFIGVFALIAVAIAILYFAGAQGGNDDATEAADSIEADIDTVATIPVAPLDSMAADTVTPPAEKAPIQKAKPTPVPEPEPTIPEPEAPKHDMPTPDPDQPPTIKLDPPATNTLAD